MSETYWDRYSTDPSQNNLPPPDGAPEGMQASETNDSMRQSMAAIREVGDQAFSTTGDRTFNTITVTADATIGGTVQTGNLFLTSNQPIQDWLEADANPNNGRWYTQASNEKLVWGTKDDTQTVGPNILRLNRAGNLLSGLEGQINGVPFLFISWQSEDVTLAGVNTSPRYQIVAHSATSQPSFDFFTSGNQLVGRVTFDMGADTMTLQKRDPNTGTPTAQIVLSNNVVNVATGILQENGVRVYSPNNPPP